MQMSRKNQINAILAACCFATLVSFIPSYLAGVKNQLTGGDWFGLTAFLLAGYLLAGVLLGVVGVLLGWICHELLRRVRRNPSMGYEPTAGLLALWVGLAAYTIFRRMSSIDGKWTIADQRSWALVAIQFAVGIIIYLIALAMLNRHAALVRAITRPRAVLALLAVGVGFYVLASMLASHNARETVAAGQHQFTQQTTGQSVNHRRVLLIGIDGASWDYVQAMMARGELPTLASMAQRGVAAPLASFVPSASPLIWNSIATGVEPARHGIVDFFEFRFPWTAQPLMLRGLPLGSGLGGLVKISMRCGIVQRRTASQYSCKLPRIWDIVGHTAGSVAVIGWWATHPAQAQVGTMISDAFYYQYRARDYNEFHHGERKTTSHTPSLTVDSVSPVTRIKALDALRVTPDDITDQDIRTFMDATDEDIKVMRNPQLERKHILDQFLFLYSMDQTHLNLTLHLLKANPSLNLVTPYFRGIDIASHEALQYGTPMSPESSPGKYGDLIRRYYIYTDGLIKQLVDAAGPQATVVVVSDHGFEKEPDGSYHHHYSPDGILFAAGPGIKQGGTVVDASVYDVFPTLLYLFDLAIPADIEGRPLVGLFEKPHTQEHPIATVPSYGLAAKVIARPQAGPDGAEAAERLRALGYAD